jgi:hypothetical protein
MWTERFETHIARHNVTASEVEQVLYGRPRLTTPRPERHEAGSGYQRQRPASDGGRLTGW